MPKKVREELRKGVQSLMCRLSEQDLQDRQETLVKLTTDRAEAEAALEHWKSDMKEEQKAKQGEISSFAAKCSRLATVIRDKEEPRQVDVTYYIKDQEVTCVRMDTGEVVSTRAATQTELQMVLPDSTDA
jgi:hypothetical protein